MRSAILIPFLLAFALSACTDKDEDSGTDGQAVAGEARVERACAPDDGSAFEFQIGIDEATCESPATGPWLRITVWSDLDPMAGGTWDLDPAAGVAGVWYATSVGSAESANAVSGTLAVDTWDEVAGATGSYDLLTDAGEHLAGAFEAVACLEDFPPCG